MSFEKAIADYYLAPGLLTRGNHAPLTHRSAAHLEELRATQMCSGCRQRIAVDVPMTVRDTRTFHASCANRAAAVVAAPARQTVIARVRGIAMSFDEQCAIVTADGTVNFELFRSGCFDNSIAGGGQRLKLNHTTAIPGEYLTLAEDAHRLAFRFAIHDSAIGRQAVAAIRAGEARGCSMQITPRARRWVRTTDEVIAADLFEVSIITGAGRPAWFGTSIELES